MLPKMVAAGLIVLLLGAGDTTIEQIAGMPYLDLLELEKFPPVSEPDVEAIEERLRREQKAEQDRLKRQEKTLEDQLETAREQLQALNKRSSRDTAEMTDERTRLQCRILDMEAEAKEVQTARERGVPILYQNKFAKLELAQRWPAVRTDVERRIEAGQARQRPFGNVEDIGVRNLEIDDIAEEQAEDIETGREVIREMTAQGLMPPVVEDKRLNRYMQELGEKIAVNSDLRVPIKVTVLDSNEINAFALPGGFLFINTGLIEKAESETELVGVMAHEIAHAAARHGPRLTKKAKIANILFQAAQLGTAIFAGPLGAGAYYALQYGFYGVGMIIDLSLLGVSREFESEADQLGAQYAWKAGYDPRGFISFFDKMASEEGYVRSASFFRTHPPYLERIVSTFSEIQYLPPKGDLRLSSSAFDEAKTRIDTVVAGRDKNDKNKPSLRGPDVDCSRFIS